MMSESRKADIFFGRIIEMIPSDLYKTEEANEESEMNARYFKHRQIPLAPDEKKLLSQKRKAQKYGTVSKDEIKSEEDEETKEIVGMPKLNNKKPVAIHNASAMKIAGIKADDSARSSKLRPPTTSEPNASTKAANASKDDLITNKKILEGSADFEFSGIVATHHKLSGGDVGKPGSKVRRLKRMLEEAESKRRRLNNLKQQGEEGREQAVAEQWTDVLKDAAGERAATDASRLKKALKRREKGKEKSAKEWQNRLDEVSDAKAKRLEKREKNILLRRGGGDPANDESTSTVAAGSEQLNSGKRHNSEKEKKRPRLWSPSSSSATAATSVSATSAKRSESPRVGFEGKKPKANAEFLNKVAKKGKANKS